MRSLSVDCVVDNQKKREMITFGHKIDKNIIYKLIFGEKTLQKKHFSHHSKKIPQKGEPTFFVRIEEFGAETRGPGHLL